MGTPAAGTSTEIIEPAGLVSVGTCVTSDVDEQARLLKEWSQQYNQISPGAFTGSLSQVCFDGINLFHEQTNQRVHQEGVAWTNSLTIAMPMAASDLLRWRGTNVEVGRIACLYSEDDIDLYTPQLCDLCAVTVDLQDFSTFAAQIDNFDLGKLQRAALLNSSTEMQSSFKSFMQVAMQTAINDPSKLHHPQVQKAMREALYAKLVDVLDEQDHHQSIELVPQKTSLVAKARAYLFEHRDEVISVADICRTLGVSRRSLQYAFQEVLGMNPVAYLRALRLNGVRRELKFATPTTSVLDVAARWGFWHPSHFSADYKQLFGELPSTTLRRFAPQLIIGSN